MKTINIKTQEEVEILTTVFERYIQLSQMNIGHIKKQKEIGMYSEGYASSVLYEYSAQMEYIKLLLKVLKENDNNE